MDASSSSQSSNRPGSRVVATAVDHPRLTQTNSNSIRAFLREYDQYAREVKERAQQISGENVLSTDVAKPVQMKFCVNSEWLESVIDLDFIADVESYEELSDEQLRVFLKSKSESSKDVITIDMLDKMVEEKLRIDMTDKDARSRIENLFVSYKSLLRRNGLSWVTKDNEKVAVYHVLSAIRPESLRQRLESDLDLSYYQLRKDFKGFMAHAMRLSEAFQLVDNGPPKKPKKPKKPHGPHGDGKRRPKDEHDDNDNGQDANPGNGGKGTQTNKKAPICLYPPHKAKGIRHYLRDCKACPENDKKALIQKFIEDRAATGPSRSTRSQTKSTVDENAGDPEDKSIGRVTTLASNDSSSIQVTFIDGNESHQAIGRADDGADESIVSSRIAERAVLNGIGKMKKIPTVTLQVALKDGSDAEKFTFSRSWTPPRTILKLAAGPLALLNIEFLVADADLAAEDLLIGLPVLRHLGVDTKTLLESQRDLLDGTECKGISSHNRHGKLGRLMISRLNRVTDNSKCEERPQTEKESKKPTKPATRETKIDFYDVRQADDPFPDPSNLDPLDIDQKEEIESGMEKMQQEAHDNGLPDKSKEELRELVVSNIDIFRTSFSSGPPAKVAPLQIELMPDAKPTRVRLRNYSQDQREFLARFAAQLVTAGMAYFNPSASWACAPLLVPKPGPAMFRFTVDLRPVNRFTVKHQFPMPNLEHELAKLSTSRYFAIFDLSHGYWQLPLSKLSQECQSFITPDGIYTPTRVLHGTTNAVMYLQATLAALLPDGLRPNILWWLDDILIHSTTVSDHLGAISLLFAFCAEYNFKLHPGKCTLFATTIRWCGRLISSDGISFDPRRIDGIRQMTRPITGADLQQFVCAMQWMRSAIPDFSSIISPLSDLLEKVYRHVGKRTRLAAGRVTVSALGWCSIHDKAFSQCKNALENQVTLAHVDISKRLCVYTDASDFFWSGIVTQIPWEDMSLPCVDQRHQPLAFLSGHFIDSSLRWSTIEKEAFAIMATIDRMHWLLASSRGFDLYTDHNNLVFLFDPTSVIADLSQTSLRKVLRWAVRLSSYSYTCIHVPGTDNVWADLLSRWTAPRVIRRLISIPALSSSSDADFTWPDFHDLHASQRKHLDNQPQHVSLKDGLLRSEDGSIWIPDDDTDLQLRLCIIAHTGPSGHRGTKTTTDFLRKHFFWTTLSADVETFVQSCIHCLSTVGGGKVPRPFGPAVHGTSANDLLQFDYIEIAKAHSGEKYVLILRDDHSNYCWLYACPETSAEHAARAIIDWSAAFGVPNQLMSDGPTHFKNEVLRLVAKGLRVPHHFTLPYSPWSNGAVERLGKELLRVFRSVVSELRLEHGEWPDLLPLVQSALNNAPSPQRANVSPVKAMTGLEPSPPIRTFYRSSSLKSVTLNELESERALNVKKLAQLVCELHPAVQDSLQRKREDGRKSASKGNLPNFMEGDFVLVAREEFHANEKLCLRWRGPRRIIKAVNDYVYEVEDLRNGLSDEVHVSRLKFYNDASLDKQEIMSHVLTSETGMIVQRLLSLEENEDGLFVRVRWKGLSASEDTLESIEQIYEDVPVLFEKLLKRKNAPPGLVKKAKEKLGI